MANFSLESPTNEATQQGFVLDPLRLWFDPLFGRIHSEYECSFLENSKNRVKFHEITRTHSTETLTVQVSKENEREKYIAIVLVREISESNPPLTRKIVNGWLRKINDSKSIVDHMGTFRKWQMIVSVFITVVAFIGALVGVVIGIPLGNFNWTWICGCFLTSILSLNAALDIYHQERSRKLVRDVEELFRQIDALQPE